MLHNVKWVIKRVETYLFVWHSPREDNTVQLTGSGPEYSAIFSAQAYGDYEFVCIARDERGNNGTGNTSTKVYNGGFLS